MFSFLHIKAYLLLIIFFLISICATQEVPNHDENIIFDVAIVVWLLNIVFFVLLMHNQNKLKSYDSSSYTPTIWYIVVSLFFFTCFFSIVSLILIIIQNNRIKAIIKSKQQRINIINQPTEHTSYQSITFSGNNNCNVLPPLPPTNSSSLQDSNTNNIELSNNNKRNFNSVFEQKSQDYNISYNLKYIEKENFTEYFFNKNMNGGFVEKVFVNQFQKVNEGDKILKIRIWENGKNHYITFLARHNGWIYFKYYIAEAYSLNFSQSSSFILIYNNEEALIKTHFFDKVVLKEDLFTRRPVIIGEKRIGSIDGFKFGPFLAYLEYNSGKHRFNILFGGRTFYLYRSQSLVLLMESGKLISLDKFIKPTNSNNEIYTQKTFSVITFEDVKTLSSEDIIKFRVINNEGVIELECDPFDKDKNNGIIQKAFKDYIEKYISLFTTIDPADYESTEKDKKEKKCYVYLMKDTTNLYYKIGISNKPKYRERTLQSEKPTIELICFKQFQTRKIAESFEKALHAAYNSKRIRGEWFKLDENDVNQIKESLI